MLPVSGLRTLLLAVEVDALSERFDADMVAALGPQLDQEVDKGSLSLTAYAVAYCQVGNPAGRQLQIRLIGETGEALDALAHKTFARGALKLMHRPAQMLSLIHICVASDKPLIAVSTPFRVRFSCRTASSGWGEIAPASITGINASRIFARPPFSAGRLQLARLSKRHPASPVLMNSRRVVIAAVP